MPAPAGRPASPPFWKAIDVAGRASVLVEKIGPIGHQAAGDDEEACWVDRGQLVSDCQRDKQIAVNYRQSAWGDDETAVRGAHDCFNGALDPMLTEDAFQTINGTVAAGRQRASGLRFADACVQSLLHALVLFRLLANGFRAADLAQPPRRSVGMQSRNDLQGAITYQLRRLRVHGLIERSPNSFRYRVTEFGFRAALFFTRAYNQILRPGLAAALPGLRAIDGPLKRAFDIVNQAQLGQNLTHLVQVSSLKLS